MRFAKGSAGHLLAEAFMLPEFYAGRRSYVPTKSRSGNREARLYRMRRTLPPIRGTFLAALQRVPMLDWDALRARAKAEAPARGYEGESGPGIALREILREERNKRKAARRAKRRLKFAPPTPASNNPPTTAAASPLAAAVVATGDGPGGSASRGGGA